MDTEYNFYTSAVYNFCTAGIYGELTYRKTPAELASLNDQIVKMGEKVHTIKQLLKKLNPDLPLSGDELVSIEHELPALGEVPGCTLTAARIHEKVIGLFVSLGRMIANVLTLGLYGANRGLTFHHQKIDLTEKKKTLSIVQHNEHQRLCSMVQNFKSFKKEELSPEKLNADGRNLAGLLQAQDEYEECQDQIETVKQQIARDAAARDLELANLRMQLNGVQESTQLKLDPEDKAKLGPLPTGLDESWEMDESSQVFCQKFENKKSLHEVLQVSFKSVFDELIEKSKPKKEGDVPRVNFNDSEKIHDYETAHQYGDNRHAVHCYIVKDLLANAVIKDGKAKLNPEVELVSWEGAKVMTADETGKITFLTMFGGVGEFTPPTAQGIYTLKDGVDFPKIVCAYQCLSERQQGHLEKLLLEPLLYSNDPDLENAKKFLNSKASDQFKFVHQSIERLANFMNATGPFPKYLMDEWEKHATNDDVNLKPFTKKVCTEPLLVEKVEGGEFVVAEVPLVSSLTKKGVKKTLAEEGFLAEITEWLSHYKLVMDNISEDRVPKTTDPKPTDSKQTKKKAITIEDLDAVENWYHRFHEYNGDEGCGWSALVNLFVGPKKNSKSRIKLLKRFIADQLEDSEIAAKYENIIAFMLHKVEVNGVNRNLTVKDYISWLKNGTHNDGNGKIFDFDNNDFGVAEITLVAELALGSKIQVFAYKDQVGFDENGYPQAPVGRHLGDMNKKLPIWIINKTDYSYYNLLPKVTCFQNDSPELKKAIEAMKDGKVTP